MTKAGAATEKEIRNPKHEIRNKLETAKNQNPKRAGWSRAVLGFSVLGLGFVSCFGFRISNLLHHAR
jgi:hypothetical protein